MVSRDMRKGVHRTVMTLGMALLLIGVVLLTVSDKVFILGICFLAAGSLAVFCYLLVTISSCLKKTQRPEAVERRSDTEARDTGQPQTQTEMNAVQFDAPRYEDVILCGSATVWTVTLGPGREPEPPSYSALVNGRQGAIGELRLPRPTLLRISSDIHEFKSATVINEERWPEPLTPPPTYIEAVRQWDDVFEPSQ
ncbi:hypothetical protein FKM82_027647 [Ascaphus truei]